MRLSIVFAIAAASFAAASALPTPAAATDKDQALKLCATNRNCGILPSTPGDKAVDLQIVQSDGTTDIVSCPSKGPCVVLSKPKNGKGRPVTVKGANPVNVIGGTPPKTGTAGGKAQPVATTGKGGTTAPAKTVKRDHRGTSDNQAVKTTGNRPGDIGWGNYGNGKGDGPTVRDHRH